MFLEVIIMSNQVFHTLQPVDDVGEHHVFLSHSASCSHCHEPSSIERSLALAKQNCTLQGIRFTPLREQVYRLILEAPMPIGAYDLLAKLQQSSDKSIAPPTVYRSLDFLLEHGLIHQLSSTKAFFACCQPDGKHTATFLMCQQCGEVQEFHHRQLEHTLADIAVQSGFLVKTSVIELSGICPSCLKSES